MTDITARLSLYDLNRLFIRVTRKKWAQGDWSIRKYNKMQDRIVKAIKEKS